MDNIVKPERTRQMITDFYRHLDDVELLAFQRVFNGVWGTLSDGHVEPAVSVTRAIPAGGRHIFWDMGMLNWSYIAVSRHLLTLMDGPFSDDTLCNWSLLVREDTSRTLSRHITWLLDSRKGFVVPDQESSVTYISAGLCIGMVPTHLARP